MSIKVMFVKPALPEMGELGKDPVVRDRYLPQVPAIGDLVPAGDKGPALNRVTNVVWRYKGEECSAEVYLSREEFAVFGDGTIRQTS